MQKNVKEKLAASLTAESVDLLPYLPYLLQDLWELGGDAKVMATLVKKNIPDYAGKKFLDLACGKGAVSVTLAKTLGVNITGVDAIRDFIEYARRKAKEFGVQDLCSFEIDDINKSILSKRVLRR